MTSSRKNLEEIKATLKSSESKCADLERKLKSSDEDAQKAGHPRARLRQLN